MIQTGT